MYKWKCNFCWAGEKCEIIIPYKNLSPEICPLAMNVPQLCRSKWERINKVEKNNSLQRLTAEIDNEINEVNKYVTDCAFPKEDIIKILERLKERCFE